MKASYIERWRVCESCDVRVPSTWGEATPSGDWLCKQCADGESENEGPLERPYDRAIHDMEGW